MTEITCHVNSEPITGLKALELDKGEVVTTTPTTGMGTLFAVGFLPSCGKVLFPVGSQTASVLSRGGKHGTREISRERIFYRVERLDAHLA